MVALRPLVAAAVVAVAVASSCIRPDYGAWDRALQANVAPGVIDGYEINVVNYSSMGADPNFFAFIDSLAALDDEKVQAASVADQYALYLNAYNAFTIKLILENPCRYNVTDGVPGDCLGPIQRIGDISHVWGRNASTIGGVKWSIGDIEDHKLLVPPLGSQLVLVCLNPGSISAADLPLKAFRPHKIEAQMETQMRGFLADTTRGLHLDRCKKTLWLSKNFYWHMDLFGTEPDLINFLLPYMPKHDQKFVSENEAELKLEFLDWDNGMNGEVPCDCATDIWNPPSLLQAKRRPAASSGARPKRAQRLRHTFLSRDSADAEEAGFMQLPLDEELLDEEL